MISNRNRGVVALKVLAILAIVAGCSRETPAGPEAPSSIAPSTLGVSSSSCGYTGHSHPVLAGSFHSIGLTLCSTHFPAGSAERAAVQMAVDHMNAVSNCSLHFYIAGTEAHTDYDGTFEDDGVNKLDFVDPADCGCSDTSFDGRTITYGNSSGDINEFDLGFDEDENWNFGPPSSWALSDGTTYFRTVLLHEIGHGLGFDHSASVTPDLSIMGGKTGKWVGMKKVGLKAYDYGHIRYHYGDSEDNKLADLVLSNYRTEDDSGTYACALNEGLSDTDVWAGQTIEMTWTRMNLGDRAAHNDYYTKVYLSTREDGGTSFGTLKTWIHTGDVAAHSTLYASTNITIPSSTPAGTYYVVIDIDYTDTIHERREDNNLLVIHEPLTVR